MFHQGSPCSCSPPKGELARGPVTKGYGCVTIPSSTPKVSEFVGEFGRDLGDERGAVSKSSIIQTPWRTSIQTRLWNSGPLKAHDSSALSGLNRRPQRTSKIVRLEAFGKPCWRYPEFEESPETRWLKQGCLVGHGSTCLVQLLSIPNQVDWPREDIHIYIFIYFGMWLKPPPPPPAPPSLSPSFLPSLDFIGFYHDTDDSKENVSSLYFITLLHFQICFCIV
jgi:hypothetical protein